jgi:hypothetical protein
MESTIHPPSCLYHFTPTTNLKSIRKFGLLVSYSQGMHDRVWLGEYCKIEWLREHIADHQKRHVDDLALIRARSQDLELFRVRDGIWVSYKSLPITSLIIPK